MMLKSFHSLLLAFSLLPLLSALDLMNMEKWTAGRDSKISSTEQLKKTSETENYNQ